MSEQLQSIFPDVDQTIKRESETFKEKIDDLDEIIEKISSINDDEDVQKISEFEFFTGGFNQKFDSFVCKIRLSTENQEFVDFLQWDLCKQIFENNILKIHIETANIYYKNEDTNESIFEFIKNQQDSSKGIINYDLSFEGSYKDSYKWVLNGYDSYAKTEFALLTLRNTKYLVYRFNDWLKSTGQPLLNIRHSKVTDDYLVAEEIQNQNWQYFIERVIEVCKSKEIGSTIKKSEDFLLTTVENVTLAKKSYKSFYNIVERNFHSTMQQLSVNEQNDINNDFIGENVWWEDVLLQLDSWIAFYFKFGRFPKVNLPYFLKTDLPISSVDLYKKFAGTDAKAVVSIHALAALYIHFGGNKYISQTAIGESLKNLTYQALSQENDKIFMSFDNIGFLVNDLWEQFVPEEKASLKHQS